MRAKIESVWTTITAVPPAAPKIATYLPLF
jgi:hypothetical protein